MFFGYLLLQKWNYSFLSLSSSSNSPELEGRGGEELGTDIANTLYRVFSGENSVDLKSLCINPKEHCWVLYVDVLVSTEMKTKIQQIFSKAETDLA